MKSSDVPFLRQEPMPETKSSTSTPSAPASKPEAKLASAAESGDPVVHKLLAERQTAQMNLVEVTPNEATEARARAAREEIDAIDKKLADLGFE